MSVEATSSNKPTNSYRDGGLFPGEKVKADEKASIFDAVVADLDPAAAVAEIKKAMEELPELQAAKRSVEPNSAEAEDAGDLDPKAAETFAKGVSTASKVMASRMSI